MKIKKGDILLIIIGLVIGIAAMCYLSLQPKYQGGYVKVFSDNKELASMPLDVDDILVIENGPHKNIITVENGFAHMSYANCPDLVCTRHKPIRFMNETIVCLPHKIVLEVAGGQEGTIDVYSR